MKTKELFDDPALLDRCIKYLAELYYAADAESLTEEQIALWTKEVATR